MTATKFTRFSATTMLGGFPLYGTIDRDNLLMLANNGTTPATPARIESLEGEAKRIETELLAGRIVVTKTATITPLAE